MTIISRTKKRITVTIFPLIDNELEKIAEKTQKSKSAIVEKAIQEYLSKQLDKDTKALSKLQFADLPDENQWLQIQPPII